jgi:hypothetical protein
VAWLDACSFEHFVVVTVLAAKMRRFRTAAIAAYFIGVARVRARMRLCARVYLWYVAQGYGTQRAIMLSMEALRGDLVSESEPDEDIEMDLFD